MRALALASLLAAMVASAAGTNPNGEPRARCASCSILPPGATGADLTLSGAINAAQYGFGGPNPGAGCIGAGSSDSICFAPNAATVNTPGGWHFAVGTTVDSNVASGSNAFAVLTNGARIDFGAGASDYASSDGTTVTFAGPVTVTGNSIVTGTIKTGSNYLNANSQVITGNSLVSTGDTPIIGNVADSAGNGAVSLTNANAMTAGVDRYIAVLTRGASGANVVARVFTDGTYQNLATVGTAASGTGVTAVYSGAVRSWLHKVTVTNAAMTAAATTDVTLAVTPSNSRIVRVVADVTQVFTGGALTAVTATCGKTAGGNEYLLSNSYFTATNTWGDVVAEMGAGVVSSTLADFGTVTAGVPGAITVQCRFTCTTANCNAATQGSATFYVEGVTY